MMFDYYSQHQLLTDNSEEINTIAVNIFNQFSKYWFQFNSYHKMLDIIYNKTTLQTLFRFNKFNPKLWKTIAEAFSTMQNFYVLYKCVDIMSSMSFTFEDPEMYSVLRDMEIPYQKHILERTSVFEENKGQDYEAKEKFKKGLITLDQLVDVITMEYLPYAPANLEPQFRTLYHTLYLSRNISIYSIFNDHEIFNQDNLKRVTDLLIKRLLQRPQFIGDRNDEFRAINAFLLSTEPLLSIFRKKIKDIYGNAEGAEGLDQITISIINTMSNIWEKKLACASDEQINRWIKAIIQTIMLVRKEKETEVIIGKDTIVYLFVGMSNPNEPNFLDDQIVNLFIDAGAKVKIFISNYEQENIYAKYHKITTYTTFEKASEELKKDLLGSYRIVVMFNGHGTANSFVFSKFEFVTIEKIRKIYQASEKKFTFIGDTCYAYDQFNNLADKTNACGILTANKGMPSFSDTFRSSRFLTKLRTIRDDNGLNGTEITFSQLYKVDKNLQDNEFRITMPGRPEFGEDEIADARDEIFFQDPAYVIGLNKKSPYFKYLDDEYVKIFCVHLPIEACKEIEIAQYSPIIKDSDGNPKVFCDFVSKCDSIFSQPHEFAKFRWLRTDEEWSTIAGYIPEIKLTPALLALTKSLYPQLETLVYNKYKNRTTQDLVATVSSSNLCHDQPNCNILALTNNTLNGLASNEALPLTDMAVGVFASVPHTLDYFLPSEGFSSDERKAYLTMKSSFDQQVYTSLDKPMYDRWKNQDDPYTKVLKVAPWYDGTNPYCGEADYSRKVEDSTLKCCEKAKIIYPFWWFGTENITLCNCDGEYYINKVSEDKCFMPSDETKLAELNKKSNYLWRIMHFELSFSSMADDYCKRVRPYVSDDIALRICNLSQPFLYNTDDPVTPVPPPLASSGFSLSTASGPSSISGGNSFLSTMNGGPAPASDNSNIKSTTSANDQNITPPAPLVPLKDINSEILTKYTSLLTSIGATNFDNQEAIIDAVSSIADLKMFFDASKDVKNMSLKEEAFTNVVLKAWRLLILSYYHIYLLDKMKLLESQGLQNTFEKIKEIFNQNSFMAIKGLEPVDPETFFINYDNLKKQRTLVLHIYEYLIEEFNDVVVNLMNEKDPDYYNALVKWIYQFFSDPYIKAFGDNEYFSLTQNSLKAILKTLIQVTPVTMKSIASLLIGEIVANLRDPDPIKRNIAMQILKMPFFKDALAKAIYDNLHNNENIKRLKDKGFALIIELQPLPTIDEITSLIVPLIDVIYRNYSPFLGTDSNLAKYWDLLSILVFELNSLKKTIQDKKVFDSSDNNKILPDNEKISAYLFKSDKKAFCNIGELSPDTSTYSDFLKMIFPNIKIIYPDFDDYQENQIINDNSSIKKIQDALDSIKADNSSGKEVYIFFEGNKEGYNFLWGGNGETINPDQKYKNIYLTSSMLKDALPGPGKFYLYFNSCISSFVAGGNCDPVFTKTNFGELPISVPDKFDHMYALFKAMPYIGMILDDVNIIWGHIINSEKSMIDDLVDPNKNNNIGLMMERYKVYSQFPAFLLSGKMRLKKRNLNTPIQPGF